MIWELVKAYTTGNSKYGDGRPNCFKGSSVKLDDGGDTHFHPWDSGRGVTVTTRLRGGVEDHTHIRDRSDSSERSSRDFNPSKEAGAAFRSVFGDDNK